MHFKGWNCSDLYFGQENVSTQIMYPSATMIIAKQPIWSFPVNYARPKGCTICVDTLHYLCRVCSENHLLKGIFYAWNVQFYRIDSFHMLILFRIMLRIKEGIYTNDVPLRAIWAAQRSGQYQSWISAIYPETRWMWKKDEMFNLVIHGIFGFIYLSNRPNWCLSFIVFFLI